MRKKFSTLVGFWMCFALLMPVGWSAPKQFSIQDGAGRDVVSFTSNAPLELIAGQTNKISGKITYDDAFKFDAQHPFDIQFRVDLNSLQTGIALRDQHMKESYLETQQFPTATYKVAHVKSNQKPPFKNGQVVQLVATGDFTVHGKTVRKTIPLTVTYFQESSSTKSRLKAGNLIRIQGTFPVVLAEHGIQRPEMAFQKLADTVFVKLDAMASDNPKAFE